MVIKIVNIHINVFFFKELNCSISKRNNRFRFVTLAANGWGCEPWGSSWRSVVIRR
jgi:hypothetical protein